jgi:hypothetical protein
VDTSTKDGETSHIASANAQSIHPTTNSSATPTLSEKASAAASNLGAQASTTASNLSAQASNAASTAGTKISAVAADLHASASETASKLSNQAADASSFAGAALSQGHPVHAAKYATTAAVIGQIEREKHAAGPLEHEADIAAKVHPAA